MKSHDWKEFWFYKLHFLEKDLTACAVVITKIKEWFRKYLGCKRCNRWPALRSLHPPTLPHVQWVDFSSLPKAYNQKNDGIKKYDGIKRKAGTTALAIQLLRSKHKIFEDCDIVRFPRNKREKRNKNRPRGNATISVFTTIGYRGLVLHGFFHFCIFTDKDA